MGNSVVGICGTKTSRSDFHCSILQCKTGFKQKQFILCYSSKYVPSHFQAKKADKASTPVVAMAITEVIRDDADDFCKGKKDGFHYIECKDGKSTIIIIITNKRNLVSKICEVFLKFPIQSIIFLMSLTLQSLKAALLDLICYVFVVSFLWFIEDKIKEMFSE